MAGIGGLLGNDVLQQLVVWQLAGQAIGAALTPYLTELTAAVYRQSPLLQLSPADAADAVIRNVWSHDRAAAEAQDSGINAERFDVLVRLAGDAPAPEAMAVALRRGLVTPARYLDGIRQGRLRDEWADLVRQLAMQDPSPSDALDALLEGQLDDARARELFAHFGGNPEHFTWLFDTRGSAPTPLEAADMAHRGIIPWDGQGPGVTSFRQAFLEGPWRNKWEPAYRAASDYLPPPRTITAMYREGSIDRPRALDLLAKQGVPADLAAAYLASGSTQKTAHARDLALGTITALYRDRLVDEAAARSMLEALGYSADEAGFVLAVEDLRLVHAAMVSAVARIHALYVGHRIDRAAAGGALTALQVPAAGAATILDVWTTERQANVRILTPAEIARAVKLGLVTADDGQARLEQAGYQPPDASLYLAIHAGVALPGSPPASTVTPTAGP